MLAAYPDNIKERIRVLVTVSGQSGMDPCVLVAVSGQCQETDPIVSHGIWTMSATDPSVLAAVSGHFGMNPNISLGIRKVRDVSETSGCGYLYFMFLLIEIIPDGCLLQLVSS